MTVRQWLTRTRHAVATVVEKVVCFDKADPELSVPPRALHDVFAAVHRLRSCQSQKAVAAVSAVPCPEGTRNVPASEN